MSQQSRLPEVTTPTNRDMPTAIDRSGGYPVESYEALWAVYFGDISDPSRLDPGRTNAGVAVLETQRIFGGDSQYYYIGKYVVEKNEITATVTITHFNGEGWSAFGGPLKGSLRLRLQGRRQDNIIQGYMWPENHPDMKLPAMLQRLEDLPSCV